MQLTTAGDNQTWASLVRQYREHLGLSMDEFGKLFGVTRQGVFYWEKGINSVPNEVTWAIMQWLKVEVK